MPPRARTTKPVDPKPAEPKTDDGEICAECWPTGWPETGATAGCIHGSWTR